MKGVYKILPVLTDGVWYCFTIEFWSYIVKYSSFYMCTYEFLSIFAFLNKYSGNKRNAYEWFSSKHNGVHGKPIAIPILIWWLSNVPSKTIITYSAMSHNIEIAISRPKNLLICIFSCFLKPKAN